MYFSAMMRRAVLMSSDNNNLPSVTIYTDGACSPNPGPGGWGAVIISKSGQPLEICGYGGTTTNNRMELTAAVEALKSLEGPHRVVLYTDSQYLKNGITTWIGNWQRKNWLTADRKPVKNAELWQQVLEHSELHEMDWQWVRGHASNRWNERADELAVAARKGGTKASRPIKQAAATDDDIHLYTGVTYRHSIKSGAWSVILIWRNHAKILGSRSEGSSANQLYIYAVIAGLESLKKSYPVHVHTFSGYLQEGATSWLSGWKKRRWQTREGNPVSNKMQWQKLDVLLDTFKVVFHLEDRDNPLCYMLEVKELAKEFEQKLAK